MNITKRPYRLLSDFVAVHNFLTKTYTLKEQNSHLLPQFFEYAHTHPWFNHKLTHRSTLWEENDEIVAFCCFEMNIGEAFLVTKKGYNFLLSEMLEQAERELSTEMNGVKSLTIWIVDTQQEHLTLLKNSGYKKVHTEPVRIFHFDKPFKKIGLPKGFECLTLSEENDLVKLHRCIHCGFNNEGEQDGDIDSNRHMQNGPNFRYDLSSVIKAPNGDYACYAGIWFDEKNKYTYLEPLCTMPEYRKKGLATYILTQAMKKTKELGATYCYGGVPEFYSAIGFETICNRELWKKEW